MLISLALVFLLTPSLTSQVSISERKNSTKPIPHAISHNVVPKTVTPAANIQKGTKNAGSVNQTESSFTENAPKPNKDTPAPSATITVIIREGCVNEDPQKNTENTTKIQEIELTVKPGSPLLMTHRISIELNSCLRNCEAEMEVLKGRVELLEKEMSAMKKQYSDTKSKLTVETVAFQLSETSKQETVKKVKAEKTTFEKKVEDENELKKQIKANINKPIVTTSKIKEQDNETKSRKEAQVLLKDGKRQDQSIKVKAPFIKASEIEKQPQGDKLVKKQEKLKDMPQSQNVSQNIEKMTNGTSKISSTLVKSVKASVNVTLKASTGKVPQSNVTSTETVKRLKHGNGTISIEKDKIQIQGNLTLSKEGKKKGEKQANVTSSTEKVKAQFQGNATLPTDIKKKMEKQLNVTSTEKDKLQIQGNATLPKDSKKKVEKQVTSFTEKDQIKIQGNATLPKDGSSGKRKIEKLVNVTMSIQKEKEVSHGDATLLKDGPSGKKKVEKQENVTNSTEKDRTQLPKEGSSGKKTESHQNVTLSEKNKMLLQSNVTMLHKGGKKNVETHTNVTASATKILKLPLGNETTTLKEVTSTKKKLEKPVIVTSFTEKETKPHQVNATLPKEGKKKVEKQVTEKPSISKDRAKAIVLKEETSGKISMEKQGNVSISTEKDKKPQLSSETPALQERTSTKKRVEKQVNVTTLTEKDKTHIQGNATVFRGVKKTVEKQVNVTGSIEKDKSRLQSNGTVPIDIRKKVQKQVNITISTEKDKIQLQSNGTHSKEGKKKVEKHFNVTSSIVSDKIRLQGNATLSKVASSGKKTVEIQVNVTSSIEKGKKPHQTNGTLLKEEGSGKKKVNTILISDDKTKKPLKGNATAPGKEMVESHGNGTTFSGKEKTLQQGSVTTKKIKVTSGVNVMVSKEKQKLSQFNNTMTLKDMTSGKKKAEKHAANGTVSTELKKMDVEKDKKQLQTNWTTSPRESPKKKVEAESKTTKIDFGSVHVQNVTATSFILTWEAAPGAFKNFTVTRKEVLTTSKDEDSPQESEDGAEIHGTNKTSKVYIAKARKSSKKFLQVLPGQARSFNFRNLQPQTRYLVSLYSGSSKIQRIFVTTGPEPPTDLNFSNITETSLSVSWTRPKSTVTGFRVTYTNTADGESGSMSVDSRLCHVLISKLSAGSLYEIGVRSLLETMESKPTTSSVTTVPDPPTDLQAVNISDTKALLTWKPAQAKVDNYILSYGSAKSHNVTVTVMLSGSSVQHQLRGLHRFTLYTVRIISQKNNVQSKTVFTTFTTSSGVKLQTAVPADVTFNSAVISWKAPRLLFRSYRLTYQHGEEVKEVILNPTVTRYELKDLEAFSNYTVRVYGETEGRYVSVASTKFTTAGVPYPFPQDCSQVQMNGVKASGEAELYPEGNEGEPVWAYCDMDTEGGGWTVFQRRVDGSTDFFRGWRDYNKGFGLLTSEFWLGNDILHTLTSLTPMSLRVDLRYGNESVFAQYSNFTVGSEASNYTISLSGYFGTAGDSMKYHNGRPFSTKDKDPDPLSVHCAKEYMGGWWYKNCYKANLNGLYDTFSENKGVVWIDWKGKDTSIPFTEMKLRPASHHLLQSTL